MVEAPNPHRIFTFVPAKDFEVSTRFYRAMGFGVSNADGVRFVELGNFGFLLQDFYVKKWADNFMMSMHVDDAQWWVDRHASIVGGYPRTWNREPELQDWGQLVAYFTDPSGVLWHVSQTPV